MKASEEAKKADEDKRFEEWEKEAEIREKELEIEAEAEAKRQEVLASINDEYFTEQIEKSDAQQVYREQKDIESLYAKQKIEKLKAEAVAQNLSATANLMAAFSDLAGKDTATGKTLAVAAATIDTYSAITGTLANAARTPAGAVPGYAIAQSIAVGIAGFMNVRKILAVKIPKQSSGGGMGTGISLPTAGGGVSSSPTQTATPLNPDGTLTSSLTGGTSTPQPQPVVVLESDIQRATQRNQQSISMSEL